MKLLSVRTLRSKNYKKVIEVRVPIRFYWSEEGFDGIEMGPLKDNNPGTMRNITELLNRVEKLMRAAQPERTDIPKPFLDAFGEKW